MKPFHFTSICIERIYQMLTTPFSYKYKITEIIGALLPSVAVLTNSSLKSDLFNFLVALSFLFVLLQLVSMEGVCSH